MKSLIPILILSFLLVQNNVQAQEKYGSTVNVGVGVGGYGGYFKYIGHNLPVLSVDYEFDAGKYFTLAPFLKFYSYQDQERLGGGTYYSYKQTVVPIGLKGTFYFDDLLNVDPFWDIYGGVSIGHAFAIARWDNDYNGDRGFYRGNSLFLNLHVGAEYHFADKIGAFLDISNGLSTIGVAFH